MQQQDITKSFLDRLHKVADLAEQIRGRAEAREHGRQQLDRVSVHSPLLLPQGEPPSPPKA